MKRGVTGRQEVFRTGDEETSSILNEGTEPL